MLATISPQENAISSVIQADSESPDSDVMVVNGNLSQAAHHSVRQVGDAEKRRFCIAAFKPDMGAEVRIASSRLRGRRLGHATVKPITVGRRRSRG
ncbi:hypothetical protein SSBR45G_57000 [Bradyrhizobium sp. SSBR45G]|nr:hypothetical protein SSBR45G_57000 [Bradyrhizobium sp. SSBR45G]GLH88171.1 hypothetical protein SSBR45R_56320 [Bradyrhizobium sp. SSBR45R]